MFHNPSHASPERFRRFADVECRESSPFYYTLSHQVAGDPSILDIAARAPVDQPPPNMLFAAVRYLLMKAADAGAPNHLAELYPSRENPQGEVDSPLLYPLFRAFCLEHIHDLRHLLQTRRVQTNEVRRSTCLMPSFALVADRIGDKSLAMIELGASAGLNMLWDRFGYTYRHGSSDVRAGNSASPVQLFSELRGEKRPPIPDHMPAHGSNTGIDTYPVDLNNDDAVRWLRALIWPEHHDREAHLTQAVELARQRLPFVRRGGALDLLPEVIDTLSEGAVPLIYHSFTVYQFTQAMRDQLNDTLSEMARYRDIYRVSLEWERQHEGAMMRLMTYHRGEMQAQTLARCEPHGRWMQWLL